MHTDINIRWVHPEDAQDLLTIYGPIVLNTTVSFEVEVPSLQDFQQRIIDYSALSPWLVAEEKQVLVGYAYATAHRSRKAYQWNQEVTVYIHKDHRQRGIARLLYLKLFEVLRMMNYCKAIAVITLPNDMSIAFHRSMGFQQMGEMKHVGFKHGRWCSTSWWDFNLKDDSHPPAELKSMIEIKKEGAL